MKDVKQKALKDLVQTLLAMPHEMGKDKDKKKKKKKKKGQGVTVVELEMGEAKD